MTAFRRPVVRRLFHRRLILRPRNYFVVKNLKGTTWTPATRHKFINELPDKINNKIRSYMCGKDHLKMKVHWYWMTCVSCKHIQK